MEVCIQAKVSLKRSNTGSRGRCRWEATIHEVRVLCWRGEWSAGGCVSSIRSWRRTPGGIGSRGRRGSWGGFGTRGGWSVRSSGAGRRYVILTQSQVTLNSVYQLIVWNVSVHVRLMGRGTIWEVKHKANAKRNLLWKVRRHFILVSHVQKLFTVNKSSCINLPLNIPNTRIVNTANENIATLVFPGMTKYFAQHGVI